MHRQGFYLFTSPDLETRRGENVENQSERFAEYELGNRRLERRDATLRSVVRKSESITDQMHPGLGNGARERSLRLPGSCSGRFPKTEMLRSFASVLPVRSISLPLVSFRLNVIRQNVRFTTSSCSFRHCSIQTLALFSVGFSKKELKDVSTKPSHRPSGGT